MKYLLPVILAVAFLATGYLYQECRKERTSLRESLENVRQEISEQEKESGKMASDLEKAKLALESANAAAKATQEASQKAEKVAESLKQQLDQLQKDFEAYKAKYRTEARAKAVGGKLDQLAVGGKVYQNVTIKSVNPQGMEISHSTGAARVLFGDLPQAWRDRFDYDPNEADAFAQNQITERTKVDQQIQTEMAAFNPESPPRQLHLGDMAQALKNSGAEDTAKLTKEAERAKEVAELEQEIKDTQAIIDATQKQHDQWIDAHRGDRHAECIPDDISGAHLQKLQKIIDLDDLELSAMGN